jgi:hypothetical protein
MVEKEGRDVGVNIRKWRGVCLSSIFEVLAVVRKLAGTTQLQAPEM